MSEKAKRSQGNEDEKNDNAKKVKGLWCWFMGFTSIGGLSQSNNTDAKIAKAVWIILFFIFAIMTILNVDRIMVEYNTNPVQTTVTQVYSDTLPFPGVTICNQNRVHCPNLLKHIDYINTTLDNIENRQKRLDTLCQIFILGRCSYSNYLVDLFTNGSDVSKRARICEDQPQFALFESLKPGDVTVEGIFRVLMGQLSDEDIYAIASHAHQFVKSCEFLGQYNHALCLALRNGDLKFISSYMGVCHGFNYYPDNGTKEDVFTLGLSGENFGLHLILDTDVEASLLHGLSPTAGAKLVLHESLVPPMTMSQGISLPTHAESKVAIESMVFEREPPPYTSKCRSDWDENTRMTDEQRKRIPYSDLLCKSFCMDDAIQNLCNCTITYLIEYDRKLSPVCDLRIAEHAACINALATNIAYAMSELDCSYCRPMCYEERHQVSLSQSTWPTSKSWPQVAAEFNVSYDGYHVSEENVLEALDVTSNDTEALDRLREGTARVESKITGSYLKVKVYFNSMLRTSIVETKKYETATLFTSLGGAISFYLGISIVSLFEFGELFVRAIFAFLQKKRNHHGP